MAEIANENIFGSTATVLPNTNYYRLHEDQSTIS